MAAPGLAQADVTVAGDGSGVLLPVVWLFLAVLVTFVVTRTVTRVIRARAHDDTVPADGARGLVGDITIGGVHVHHQVFGIITMATTGIITIATTPTGVGLDVAAAVFGVGMGLTFDEFALWVHLDDVYWTESGRASVDAVFVLLMVTGLYATGFTLLVGAFGSEEWWYSVAGLAVTLLLSVVCLLKGKIMTAVVGLLFFPAAVVGVCRLAKPESWWAHRRYATRPRRLARAQRRFGPAYEARWNRVRDLVAGAPTRPAA